MSDELQNAATIASLRAEVERLTAELQGERDDLAACYKAKATLIDERDACLRELDFSRADVQRVTNRQTMDREEIESMGRRNDELRSEVSAIGTRLSMEQEDHAATRKELDAVVILLKGAREALDTARERAGVLEAEVKAWRNLQKQLNLQNNLDAEMLAAAEANARMFETDDRNALDAAKFGGAT